MSELDTENWMGEACSIDTATPTPVLENKTTDTHLSANRTATTVLFGYRYNNPSFWNYVEEKIREFDAVNPFKRRRKRSIREHGEIKNALGNVLLTLFKSMIYFLGAPVGINLNSNFYSKRPTRYRKYDPSYRTMIAIYFGLRRLKLIDVVRKGSFNRTEDRRNHSNKCTRIIPTDKLFDEIWNLRINLGDVKYDLAAETIILRKTVIEKGAKFKIDIDYVDNSRTKKMRNDLLAINRLLEQSHVDIELTDKQYSEMQHQLMNDPKANYQPIDLTRKYLKRIFNEDFKHGGRFYGTFWQQIGRQWRKFIKINGNRTVEMDYKSLHPTLLYSLAKRPMPADPYDVGLGAEERKHAKHMFNAIINASDKRIQKPQDYNTEKMGLSWKDLRIRIEEMHQPIKKYFYSGFGLRLQNLDAHMANYVTLNLAQEDIPCLVIHDSFIVGIQHGHKLKKRMQEAVNKFVMADISIKIEEGEPNQVHIEDKDEQQRKDYKEYIERLKRYINKKETMH